LKAIAQVKGMGKRQAQSQLADLTDGLEREGPRRLHSSRNVTDANEDAHVVALRKSEPTSRDYLWPISV